MKRLLSRWLSAAPPEPGSSAPATTPTLAPNADGAAFASDLAGLLGTVDEMLFVLDDAGCFAAMSGPLLQLLDLRENEVLGVPAEELFKACPGLLSSSVRKPVRFRCRKGADYGAIIAMSEIPVSDTRAFRVGLLSQVGIETVVDTPQPPPEETNEAANREDLAPL